MSPRIAFVGKGGSGKTTLPALFARHLAHSGAPVPVIDGGISQHLAQAQAPGEDDPAAAHACCACSATTHCTRATSPRPAESP
ncbi:hypothetical protein GCM10010294_64090 [Streptomyces griseoloalbus]|nr:hypothetical protein GCM10010294_64090 [Streptomyces griseoloalbus]